MVWYWLPLLLTALVRVVWLELVPVDPLGLVDAEGFHLLAVNVLDGKGFAIGWTAPFCPTAVRTPAYPFFLMGGYELLGRSPERIVRLHVLLEVLTAALLIVLTRDTVRAISRPRLRLAKRWSLPLGLIAGTIYALNGMTQRFTGYLLSETLLLPLLTGALWSTMRLTQRPSMPRAVSAGALWGLALLVKPNGQFLVLVIGLVLAARLLAGPRAQGRQRRCPVVALTFWVALVLLVFPWLVRNRLLLGRWSISAAFAENLARVSAVATLAEMEGVRAEPWTDTWEHLYRNFVARVGAQHGWGDCLRAGGPLGPLTCVEAVPDCALRLHRTAQIWDAARSFVLRHWRVYLRVHLKGALKSLLNPGHRLWYHILTGCTWDATGVVPDIWRRMSWSFARGAVGDALRAFWMERVSRVSPLAGLLWWGLIVIRTTLCGLGLRGIWRLRSRLILAFLLGGTLVYHLVLPGPIAHDRLYAPALTAGIVLVVIGALPEHFIDADN
ncbi:MAG: hypothetical protein ACP5JG_02450 [Anaerolineae bacterium]